MRQRVLFVVNGFMLLSVILEFLDISLQVILLFLEVLLLGLIRLALVRVLLVAEGCHLFTFLGSGTVRLLSSLEELIGAGQGHKGFPILWVQLAEVQGPA